MLSDGAAVTTLVPASLGLWAGFLEMDFTVLMTLCILRVGRYCQISLQKRRPVLFTTLFTNLPSFTVAFLNSPAENPLMPPHTNGHAGSTEQTPRVFHIRSSSAQGSVSRPHSEVSATRRHQWRQSPELALGRRLGFCKVCLCWQGHLLAKDPAVPGLRLFWPRALYVFVNCLSLLF